MLRTLNEKAIGGCNCTKIGCGHFTMDLERVWYLPVAMRELEECREEAVCIKRIVRKAADETEPENQEKEPSPNEKAEAQDLPVLDRMKLHQ